VKAGLYVLGAAFLAACMNPRPSARRDSDTVYLHAGDRSWQRDKSTTQRTVSTQSFDNVVNRVVPKALANDPFSTRRSQLQKRIEDLTNEEADSVCLIMELIPREQIFDRSIKPKQILLRYINRANSEAELDSLEHVLNEPRR
jgi:hypothetical protein